MWPLGGGNLHDENKKWQSLVFNDVRSKADAEMRLSLLIADRERGKLNLPNKNVIPTLSEYSQKFIEFLKSSARENTFKSRKTTLKAVCQYLGDYRLDRLTHFILEKYRIDRQKKDGVKPISVNMNLAALNLLLNRAVKEGIISNNPCSGFKPSSTTNIRLGIIIQ